MTHRPAATPPFLVLLALALLALAPPWLLADDPLTPPTSPLTALLTPPDGPGLSIGNTSTGRLQQGIPIDRDGQALAQLPTHRRRQSHFGARSLTEVLQSTAEALQRRAPGPRLMLGDLSNQEGGDIRRHRSHRNGRDVDLAFFMRDQEGHPIEAQRFVRFDANGVGCDGACTFDLQRNWELVETLLSDHDQSLQYLFIYEPLRVLLLIHARDSGADPRLRRRAARVLRQPSDSAPHDDHYHLRVYCSVEDRLAGCQDRPPHWSWVQRTSRELAPHAQALGAALATASGEDRLLLLARIQTIAHPSAAPALIPLLTDPELSDATRDALQATGVNAQSFTPLLRVWQQKRDTPLAPRLLDWAAQTGHPWAPAWLTAVARGDGEQACQAARSLARLPPEQIIPYLVGLLDAPTACVQQQAQQALVAATAQQPPENQAPTAFWRAWWAEKRGTSRADWLMEAFRDGGLSISGLDDYTAVPALIDSITDGAEALSANAEFLLTAMTGHWVAAHAKPGDRQAAWRKWWHLNQPLFLP